MSNRAEMKSYESPLFTTFEMIFRFAIAEKSQITS